MAKQVFQAIESQVAVRSAMKAWRNAFAEGAEASPGMSDIVEWHPRLGIWGHFGGWTKAAGTRRYWNGFGMRKPNYRQNIIVEVNPPDGGTDKVMQGILATAEDGSRWVLHKGRLAIPGKGISEEEFDVVAQIARVPVSFANGTETRCHLVACIDFPAAKMQEQMAIFVARCRIVRTFYGDDAETAAQDALIEEVERSIPELTGPYEVGPQAPKIVERKHGEVWKALVSALDQRNVAHTNQRVGRWGPDLRTKGVSPLLFEIKVTVSAHDLQRAVGQLLLYERLLSKAHRKVLVLPAKPADEYVKATESLGLSILTYTKAGRTVAFPAEDLKKLL